MWRIFGVVIPTWLYRLTRGTILPKRLLLTTRGRKTGRFHTTPLGYLEDHDSFVVIGSNRGQEKMPGWYLNLRAEPRVDVQIKGQKLEALAELVPEGVEREQLWDAMAKRLPEYRQLQTKTTRVFPVVRLTPSRDVRLHDRTGAHCG